MSSTNYRRERRHNGTDFQKGMTLKKLGNDKNGKTVYVDINVRNGKQRHADRVAPKNKVLIPAYVFNSFRKLKSVAVNY